MGLLEALKRAFASPPQARPGGWRETRLRFERDAAALESTERLRSQGALKPLHDLLYRMSDADPPHPGAERLRHQVGTRVVETRGWVVGEGFGPGEVYFPEFIWLTIGGQLWWGPNSKWIGDPTPGAWYGIDDDDFRLGCHHDSSSAEYRAIGSISGRVENLINLHLG
jgi:hypothetical protein